MKEFDQLLGRNEKNYRSNTIPYESYLDKRGEIRGKRKLLRDEHLKSLKLRQSYREHRNTLS